jgi:hypothetical protein
MVTVKITRLNANATTVQVPVGTTVAAALAAARITGTNLSTVMRGIPVGGDAPIEANATLFLATQVRAG